MRTETAQPAPRICRLPKGTPPRQTDRIIIDPAPGLADRIAEALFPWLRPSPAALQRQHELTEPEAGL